MPEANVDHIYDYDSKYLADILSSVKTIAMVGASADKTKFSYGVLRVLHETGYDMIPVNPNPNLTEPNTTRAKEILLKMFLIYQLKLLLNT